MVGTRYISEDLVTVHTAQGRRVLAWGDAIEVMGNAGANTQVRIAGEGGRPLDGEVRGKLPTQAKSVLKFSMVDVQQGDGLVVETPEGKVILIDGGDNQLFARYLAARYQGSSTDAPLEVDAIVVTHGDADHFDGLNKIRDSEKHKTPRKRLFLHPKRVYHNGLVKGPSKLDDGEMFGTTVDASFGLAIADLYDDPRDAPATHANRYFQRWNATLNHWEKRGTIDLRRLAFGNKNAFSFLEPEGIEVEVIGPIERRTTRGGKRRTVLTFLRTPPKTVELPLGVEDDGSSKRPYSASHTINGHSVAFRMTYGNVRFLFTGDLNQESMELLRKKVGPGGLQAEIFKAPHHGSADFDLAAIEAVAPVVSMISSGDESSRKEYIHPRATLIGALGRASRASLPIVLCTELAAFFELRGSSKTDKGKSYFGFERTSFGIIQIRTDGRRVLVFTHSGKENMKEAYRFTVDEHHAVKFAADVRKR